MQRFALLLLAGLICVTGPALAGEKKAKLLFNGKDLSGWEYYLVEPDVKMKDVWSVQEGLLTCKGEPMGYLATKDTFKNFKLIVEWRWPKKPGNSGVLMRITGEPAALPRCVEAQLMNGSAGDIWAFKGFKVKSDVRFKEFVHDKLGPMCGVSKAEGNEKKPGEWNKYEITLKDGDLTLVVNGKTVNQCSGVDQVAGKIGLQSEGGVIQFKTVKLIPIK